MSIELALDDTTIRISEHGKITMGNHRSIQLPGQISHPNHFTKHRNDLIVSLQNIPCGSNSHQLENLSSSQNCIMIDADLNIDWVIDPIPSELSASNYDKIYNLNGRIILQVTNSENNPEGYCEIHPESGELADYWQLDGYTSGEYGSGFKINHNRIDIDFNSGYIFINDDLVVFTSSGYGDGTSLKCFNLEGELLWDLDTQHTWLHFDFYPCDGIIRYWAQPTRSNNIKRDIDIETGEIR